MQVDQLSGSSFKMRFIMKHKINATQSLCRKVRNKERLISFLLAFNLKSENSEEFLKDFVNLFERSLIFSKRKLIKSFFNNTNQKKLNKKRKLEN